jgi:hypothetical protein
MRNLNQNICKPVEPMKLEARVRKVIGMYDRIGHAVKR